MRDCTYPPPPVQALSNRIHIQAEEPTERRSRSQEEEGSRTTRPRDPPSPLVALLPGQHRTRAPIFRPRRYQFPVPYRAREARAAGLAYGLFVREGHADHYIMCYG
jgi:hypothetical protein